MRGGGVPGRPQAIFKPPRHDEEVVEIVRLNVPLNSQRTTVSMPNEQVPFVAVPVIVPGQVAAVVPR